MSPPPFRPPTKDRLAGQPAVRVDGVDGGHGFNGVLVRWHEDASGPVATVWGGRVGHEQYRTVAASRVHLKRRKRSTPTP